MCKLEPGMADLELDGPNSIVWMATVFGPGKQSEFQAQAPRASHDTERLSSEIAGIIPHVPHQGCYLMHDGRDEDIFK
jgi:hypothetical protein